ncbi:MULTISPECIES: hypothetical protein [unclassified Algibacter]|uniref:hypothetical protein n=1 Tax=unclassified Algibacter TaxID=2615009 RepID=UPI00131E5F03|nr:MULTISPECIES: hypothetical protein [unclassified Algibacter]MCL5126896.1 hypothetical protein [Algibacter sp. L4_22]
MALFKIYTDKEGLYRFFLKTDAKHISFMSAGFSSKLLCLRKIELFRKQAFNNNSYLRLASKNGNPYFKFIKGLSNEVVGFSEFFLNQKIMEQKIDEIKKVALFAKIDNLTYAV